MAYGKVGTGVSNVYAAKYEAVEGVVSYTGCVRLARLVSAGYEIDVSDNNDFYADNQRAEREAGTFQSGTLNLTVDGMFTSVKQFVLGLPTPGEDGALHYDDDQVIPYLGVGYIEQDMSDGVLSYTPVVVKKCQFNQPSPEHNTREDQIDWQTIDLTAAIMRDDTAKHEWLIEGQAYSTLEAADAWLQAQLGMSGE